MKEKIVIFDWGGVIESHENLWQMCRHFYKSNILYFEEVKEWLKKELMFHNIKVKLIGSL